MAGVAASIGARAPVEVVFVLAPLTALSLTVTRPPQAAVLPAIVRSADELTAANVMGGWTDGAAALVGPGLAGVLLAWHGPGLAIAATATMSAAAAFLVAGVTGPAAAISSLGDDGDVTEQDDGRAPGLVSGTSRALKSIGSGAVQSDAGRPQLADQDPADLARLLFHAHRGAGPALCHPRPGLVAHGSRRRRFPQLRAGRRRARGRLRHRLSRRASPSRQHAHDLHPVAVVALATIDAVPKVAPAIVLIAIVGLSGAVFDVTGRTLLQRSAPADAIAGSFSILEALMDTGLALGTVLVRLAIAIGGLKAALAAPAVIALVLVAGMWRQYTQDR